RRAGIATARAAAPQRAAGVRPRDDFDRRQLALDDGLAAVGQQRPRVLALEARAELAGVVVFVIAVLATVSHDDRRLVGFEPTVAAHQPAVDRPVAGRRCDTLLAGDTALAELRRAGTSRRVV